MKGAGALTRKDRHRIGRRSIAAEARTSKEAGLGQWPGAGRGKRDATLTFENFAYLALGLTHDAPIEAPTRMLAAQRNTPAESARSSPPSSSRFGPSGYNQKLP